MRIAVTGRAGQLARALAETAAAHGVTVVPVGRPALDLAHPDSVAPALAAAAPDVIVNAAAYTAVDKAEAEPELAMTANRDGAGAVAVAAAALGVPVIHLSTDYVFDGTSPRPYREDDVTVPLGVYGRSKWLGEQAVMAAGPRHLILRTAWVYAPFGANFVRTMLRLAQTRQEIGVVADQRGCPTAALDLATVILAIAPTLVRPETPGLFGLFHATGQGEATWADVAEAVFARSAALGGPTATVKRIATSDYPTPARRPANACLDGAKLERVHGLALPPWRGSLEACVTRLLRD